MPPATDDYLATASVAPHNAWVLLASLLMLLMASPGLALYYGGLVRKKNVLSMMMQCIFLIAFMSLVWAVVGYSLSFGKGGSLVGDFEFVMMRGVARSWDAQQATALTPMFNEHLPRMTHMLYQSMFFIIAPIIVCGAFAERMKFSALLWFALLWGLLVYCPLAHWVWGGGFLTWHSGLLGGSLDFAGGMVVHVSGGLTALVAAIMIGPRLGYRQEPMPPHNLTYTALGTSLMWIGWCGFNAGSALEINGIATSAVMTTHFSAAAGAIVWAACEWWQRTKPSVLGVCSGAVSGLVCITPAAGYVGPMSAIAMGAIAGFCCFLACYRLKWLLNYDDALDAFGVHGIGGITGALLTGIFATRSVNNLSAGAAVGAIDGNWMLIVAQLVALLIASTYVIVMSVIIFKVIDMLIGLRVNSTMERQGLDVTLYGEEGYIFL